MRKITIYISFILLFACNKKADLTAETQNSVTLNDAKDFIVKKSSTNTDNQSTGELSINNKGRRAYLTLNHVIDWNTFKALAKKSESVAYARLEDKGIQLTEKTKASRFCVFYKSNNKTCMQILELFNESGIRAGEMDEIIAKEYFKADISGNTNLQTSCKAIIYDEDYRYIRSADYSQKAGKLKFRVNGRTKSNLALNTGNDKSVKTDSEPCVEWGVYMVTYDDEGNELYKALLYSYWRGDCQTGVIDFLAPDYGGAGPSEEEEIAKLWADFQEATRTQSLTDGENIYCVPNPDNFLYYNQVQQWPIVTGFAGFWKIVANSSITYKRDRLVVNANTIEMANIYDISYFNTEQSHYMGTNITVKTVWTEETRNASIHFNNTTHAKGVTRVTGRYYHVSKIIAKTRTGVEIKPESTSPGARSVNIIPR
jgi:hypothetical protein